MASSDLTPEFVRNRGLILFHGGCQDGNAAASCFYIQNFDRKFIGIRHDEQPPWSDISGENIAICDFSFDRQTTREICRRAAHVVVLDHHRSAVLNLNGLDKEVSNLTLVLDETLAGAQIAWDFVFPNRRGQRPQYIEVIADRDTDQFRIPYTQCLTAGFYLHRYTTYQTLAQRYYEEQHQPERLPNGMLRMYMAIFHAGYISDEKDKEYCRGCVRYGYKRMLTHDGTEYKVMVFLNFDYTKRTMLAKMCFQNVPECQIAILCLYNLSKDIWKISLRSQDIDVEPIARSFGGGGHPHACSFFLPPGQSLQSLFPGEYVH